MEVNEGKDQRKQTRRTGVKGGRKEGSHRKLEERSGESKGHVWTRTCTELEERGGGRKGQECLARGLLCAFSKTLVSTREKWSYTRKGK
jgi:hypothetical protein